MMAVVLVATESGCRVFEDCGEIAPELDGRQVSFLVKEPAGGTCLATIDYQEIWRRDAHGFWSLIGKAHLPLQSLTSVGGIVFAGGLNEAAMLRVDGNGTAQRLPGFDATPCREEWFAGGPPLGVRSLAATADGAAVLAAVHVGGIPRSVDGGASWTPTIPVIFDVHELCAHSSLPGFVAAACAVGLCLSRDGGATWKVVSESIDGTTSLAVAVLGDEVLFSVQDGPFASHSQLWRWRSGAEPAEQVRDGLPEWLEGKVDTGHIAAAQGRAAMVDGGGNLWLSQTGSSGWERIATGLPYAFGVSIV